MERDPDFLSGRRGCGLRIATAPTDSNPIHSYAVATKVATIREKQPVGAIAISGAQKMVAIAGAIEPHIRLWGWQNGTEMVKDLDVPGHNDSWPEDPIIRFDPSGQSAVTLHAIKGHPLMIW